MIEIEAVIDDARIPIELRTIQALRSTSERGAERAGRAADDAAKRC